MSLASSFEMIDRQTFTDVMWQRVPESGNDVRECSSTIGLCAIRLLEFIHKDEIYCKQNLFIKMRIIVSRIYS